MELRCRPSTAAHDYLVGSAVLGGSTLATGVAIYFTLSIRQLAIWLEARVTNAAANMHTFGVAMETMRQLEWHGAVMTEQVFADFMAPASLRAGTCSASSWVPPLMKSSERSGPCSRTTTRTLVVRTRRCCAQSGSLR
jgi:hypothetical protein